MAGPDQHAMKGEIERLRAALDAETGRCLELQRQVDRAGAEFEEFVSTAAHNLRDSLRDMASYSQLMTETYAGRLDSDAGIFLERIQAGAVTMQSLLAGMVEYSSDLGDRQPTRTDLEDVLRQALLCMGELITKRAASVTHDPLPNVTGDFDVLTKVLQHLIRNAIGYCDAQSPHVHISARKVDLNWVISVQDNGPGIEPAFREQVFGVFRRLHGKEHPGNGLGLAFCRRAIEWHDGRIWVEPEAGGGSIFYFTLPAAD